MLFKMAAKNISFKRAFYPIFRIKKQFLQVTCFTSYMSDSLTYGLSTVYIQKIDKNNKTNFTEHVKKL